MLKKLFYILILSFILIICLVGCSSEPGNVNNSNNSSKDSTEEIDYIKKIEELEKEIIQAENKVEKYLKAAVLAEIMHVDYRNRIGIKIVNNGVYIEDENTMQILTKNGKMDVKYSIDLETYIVEIDSIYWFAENEYLYENRN